MPVKTLAEGNGRRVRYWAQTQAEVDGVFCNCPTIKLAEINKIAKIISYYIDLGNFPGNWKKFHQVEGPLYEIKSHQIRLIGFFYGSTFVVVLCVRKKKDDLNPSDVKKAKRLLALAKQELQNGI